MRIMRVGTAALLLEVDDPAGWFVELSRARAAGTLTATEIVPAAATVLLDGVTDPDALARVLETWPPPAGPAAVERGLVEIPVGYGGEDLDDVAGFWGVAPADVVSRLSGTEFHVAFCGFAPGFAYLAGLPASLAVPRLPSPRPKVPAGSVALAGEYAGIYPTASPGGWRLVGRTDTTLFDVDSEPPALLVPGVRVRLVPS